MMEKSNYKRRVPATETRRRSASGTRGTVVNTKKDFKEVILTQTIVSAIVLASVMFICVVKTDFTISLRQNLKKALSTSTTADEMKQTTNLVSSKYLSIQNTVKTIFGNTVEKEGSMKEEIEQPTNIENKTDKTIQTNKINETTEVKPVNENVETATQQTDRIDEDILKNLDDANESSINQKK